MKKNVLLLGKKIIVVDNVKDKLTLSNINLFSGTNLDDVKKVFSREKIDIVIMGAGIDIENRLNIIKTIFNLSKSTTVHMKDFDSGPEGMIPFVNGVLNGLNNILTFSES